MKFATFMASGTGRAIRAVAGAVLIWVGLGMSSIWGTVLLVVGVVAVLSGVVNFCLIAPLIGAPFMGKDVNKTPNTPAK